MTTTDLDYLAREMQLPFAGDRDAPFAHAVTASLDQILYAEQLRLRLREVYQPGDGRSIPLWCVGAD